VNEVALQLDPAFVPAWFLRGTMLCELKRFDEGLTCYGRVLAAGPHYFTRWSVFNEPGMAKARYSDALYCKAQALRDSGRPGEADYAYHEAIAFDPKNPLASEYTKKQ
jgi:tetratricopeptide (TPR) repeat protein